MKSPTWRERLQKNNNCVELRVAVSKGWMVERANGPSRGPRNSVCTAMTKKSWKIELALMQWMQNWQGIGWNKTWKSWT
jgi:hypothetical protein